MNDLFEQPQTGTPEEALANDESLFVDLPSEDVSSVDRRALNNKALLVALARLPNNGDPELALAGGGLEDARNVLGNLQEQNVRNQIAADRAVTRMSRLKEIETSTPLMTPEQSRSIDGAYKEVLQWDREEQAQKAVEEAAIDKMEDMAARDPVQAKVLLDNLEKGDANQVKRDFQIKMLKLMQLSEVYDQERQQEGWGSWAINLVLGLVPTNFNFSRTGIVDTKEDSMFDFLQVGNAIQKQGNAVWNMPMKEFLEFTKEGGELDKSIRANADDFLFGKFDPSAASDIMQQFVTQTASDRFWANLWGGVEVASITPVGKITNMTKTLVTAGARKEAAAAVRETADLIATQGAEAATKAYGITEKEVVDNMKISAVDPSVSTPNSVPLAMDVAAREDAAREALSKLPGIIRSDRLTDGEEIKAAYDALIKDAQNIAGRPIKDVSEVKSEVLADGSKVSHIEVTFGKRDGSGFASERTARNAAKSWGLPGAQITVHDTSGQFFVKTRLNMPETGFFTNPLHPGSQSWWARMVGTAPRISDKGLHGKAVEAGATIGRMHRIIDKNILKPVSSLNRESKDLVQQISLQGANHGKWWTDTEFNIMTQRSLGRAATTKELEAYRALQTANDMDWVLRNDLMYKDLLLQGMENASFRTKWGQDIDILGRINYKPDKVPEGRVYDASNNVHYTTQNPMSEARLRQMSDEGYVLINVKDPIKLPDGTNIKQVMVKKSDANFKGLDRNQLAYAEGGHRLYEADYRYFIKQASEHVQPDTGTVQMLNPNTFVAARNLVEAKAWADTMNKAVKFIKDNPQATAADLEELIFQGNRAFPSGEEFLKQVRDGHINKKYEFEAVFDRDLPTAYKGAQPSALSFMDPDSLGAVDYLKTTGRMFYSGKGQILKDTTGEVAVTVDPFDAIATSLRQVTRSSGLSNYKFEALERFMKTYGNHLEPGLWRTPIDIFQNATVKASAPKIVKDQIESQRSAIRNVLGFETPFERHIQERTRQMAEWVLGEGSGARKIAHDAVWWFKSKNPISYVRGLAFDAKLGMFNVGQLFIQTSTIASAIALNPKFGMKGAMGLLPMHSFLMSKGSENVLDLLSKRGVGKAMGFNSEVEFKEYARNMWKSGFMEMNGSHVMVGEYGPSAVFGSFDETQHAIREKARVFFYTAETYNRLVAYRIAYGEALDQGAKVTDGDFTARVLGLADDYSFNMTHESAAWWQKGVLSIPTQFWAYNVRMMDALLGSRFTPAQRMRLLGMQVFLAGSAGVPILEAVSEYAKNSAGKSPDIETLAGTFDRGFVDRFWFEMTGADVRLGEKLGTGGWVTDVVADIFGAGEYGEKPFDEMIGGASWSIAKGAGGVMWDTAQYAWAEGGGGELSKDSLLKMAMEVSTVGNALKANMVYNYGMLKSKQGTVLAADLPSQDAMFVALGFQPQESRDMGHMFKYLENRKEAIDEASKVVRNWRQEAFTNPDMYTENMQKVSAFMQLQRPEDRAEILRQTNKITDRSLYDFVARKYNEETMKEGALNGESN